MAELIREVSNYIIVSWYWLCVSFSLLLGLYILGAILYQFICIVWAPIAGILCGIAAQKNGLSAWKYVIIGAFYSTSLLLPWLRLMRRLQEGQDSYENTEIDYNTLYILWLVGIISYLVVTTSHMLLLGNIPLPPDNWSWSYLSRNGHVFYFALYLTIAISLIVWAITGKKVKQKYSYRRAKEDSLQNLKFPDLIVPVLPYMFASANIVAFPVVMTIVYFLIRIE